MAAIEYIDQTPKEIRYFDEDLGDISEEQEKDITDSVAEIFQTPLTGAYNWDYSAQDNRIKKLYELGKELNWNGEIDIDWDRPFPEMDLSNENEEGRALNTEMDLSNENEEGRALNPFADWEPYERMSDEDKQRVTRHMNAWGINQFLHGEQGALLVASQLVSAAPTYNAKLYAASQAFDEARHVEVFNRYCQERLQLMYPVNNALKDILDKILTDERWDLKFIGMQIIIEGLALSAFNTFKAITPDPVLHDLLHLVIRDEARHVTFGVNYLEAFVKELTDEEREERAMFAYEACVLSRERLIATDVFEEFGWDVEEARKRQLDGVVMKAFRNLLFNRVIPNLKRIGLLTDKVRPLYEALGVLEYENLPNDGVIDWAELSKPLDEVDDAELGATAS